MGWHEIRIKILNILTGQFFAWYQQTEISCLQIGQVPWMRTWHTLKWFTTRFIRIHPNIWQPLSRQRHACIRASIHFFIDDSWLFYETKKLIQYKSRDRKNITSFILSSLVEKILHFLSIHFGFSHPLAPPNQYIRLTYDFTFENLKRTWICTYHKTEDNTLYYFTSHTGIK